MEKGAPKALGCSTACSQARASGNAGGEPRYPGTSYPGASRLRATVGISPDPPAHRLPCLGQETTATPKGELRCRPRSP